MITTPLSTQSELSAALARGIHDHWPWFIVEGVVLSVLGVGAIIVPSIAGVVTTLFLGWLFVIAGVVGLIATFNARQAPGFVWALLSALLAMIAGGLLLWNPLRGLVTLSYVLVAYFIIDGIFMIFLALAHRRELTGRWEWLLVNGAVDLILAGIVISGMPRTLVWVLGMLVGIDLLFGGASLIAIALGARKQQADA